MSRSNGWVSILQSPCGNRAPGSLVKSNRRRWRRVSVMSVAVLVFALCFSGLASGQSIDVGSSSDLNSAIQTINSDPTTSYTLNFVSGVTMSQQVPDIAISSHVLLSGNSNTIDGANLYQPLVIDSGTVAIQNLNIINSTITINGGTLTDLTGNLAGTISNNGTVNFNETSNFTFGGSISGTGQVQLTGGNTVTFTGVNSYTGGTLISNGSTLNTTTGNLVGPVVTNYLLQFNQASAGTYSGNISGSGAVAIIGGGQVTLSGLNTYAGSTYVGAQSTLIGTTGSVQGAITNNGLVQLKQTTSGTYSGMMSGKGSLEISGGGTVTLTGLNSYTGGTTVDAGNAVIGTTDSLVGNISNNGKLQFSAGSNGAINVATGSSYPAGVYNGNLSGTGSVEISGSSPVTFAGTNSYSGGTLIDTGSTLIGTTSSLQGAITTNGQLQFNQTTDGTYSGPLSGTGSLSINGGGIVSLTGQTSYTGGTSVLGGSGLIGTTDNLIGNITNNGDIQFYAGTNGGLNVNTGQLDAAGVYSGKMIGTGNVEISGAGPITFTGANSYSGWTLVDSGSKLIGTTSSLQGSIYNFGSVQFNQATSGTYAGAMNDSGSLKISGGGTITLTGLNSYTGGTTVDAGSKLIGSTDSLIGNITNNGQVRFSGGSNGGFNVNSGTLDVPGVYSGILSGIGGVEISGTSAVLFTGANTYSGGTLVDSGSTLIGTTTSLQGAITDNGQVQFYQTRVGTYAGILSGTGSVEISGNGAMTLSGLNTYTGGTTVDLGSSLVGSTDSVIGNITNDGVVQLSAGSKGGYDVNTGKLDAAGVYSGNITGTGGVEISGISSIKLTGTNSYSGGTLIDAGSTLIGTTSSVQGLIYNSGKVQFNQTTSGAYSGIMGGTGNVQISGGGTVTFSGLNQYTGGTTVDAGSKLVGTTDSLIGNIANNGQLQFSAGSHGGYNVNSGTFNAAGIYSGNLTGTGSVEISGAGPVGFNGTNTYSGGTLIDAGSTLVGTTSSLQGAITNNGQAQFYQTSSGTYAGLMSGTGRLEISGSGIITLTGLNTYSGGTTVDSGSALIGSTDSLVGNIRNNGILEIFNGTHGGYNVNTGKLDAAGVYSGNLSGSGGIEISGGSTVTLTGTNTYAGGTYVDQKTTLVGTTTSLQGWIENFGNVQFKQATSGTYAAAMGGSGGVEISGGGTVTFTGLNGYSGGTTVDAGSTLIGSTDSLIGNITNNGRVQFSSGSVGGYNSSSGATDPVGVYSGNLNGSGRVEISGAGPITFTGTNIYTGGTLVDAGSTLIGATSSVQGSITNNGLVEFYQSANGAYSGNMTGSGAVVVAGASELTFNGTNTYTGGTTVMAGATLNGSTNSIQGSIVNNGFVIFSLGANGTYAGNMSGLGGLEVTKSASLTLSGTNTYSGGTLVDTGSTLFGTTGSIQGLVVDNGTVQFLQSTNGTYGSNLVGSGAVVVGGGGQVTFSGNNTYFGGTTINNGTTLIGTTSSLQGAIVDKGSLVLDQSSSGTFTSFVSGTGSVKVTGGGSLTFTGANNYTGGTTVDSGTKLIGTSTSLQGQILNNGQVVFDQSAIGAYAGNMSGIGSVLVNGTSAVSFTGTNSYTGGTTVNLGSTLAGTTSGLQGSIVDNGIVQFNQTKAGTFGGVISGSGGVQVSGFGPITMTSVNTYTGGTTIGNGSTLIVGPTGSIGSVTVNNGGILQGEGSVGTTTVNAGGTVYPGTVGAPLTINGNYSQTTGSTYSPEISPTASDKIIVTGTAQINTGTSLNLIVDPGTYTVGTSYQLLTAAGGLTGTYSAVSTSNYSQNIVFNEHYSAKSLQLTVASDLLKVAQTPNQIAVASVIDQASGAATGTLATQITQLTSLNAGQTQTALNQLSGDIIPSLATIQRQTTTAQLQLLSNRLALMMGPGSTSVAMQRRANDIRLVSSQPSGSPSSSNNSTTKTLDWSTWAQGYGLGGNIAGNGNAGGVNYRLGGTLFGVERWLSDRTLFGVFGGFSANSLGNGQDGSNAQVATYQVGLYELHQDDWFYLSNIDSFNNDNYSTSRGINLGASQLTASGNSSGNEWAHYTELGTTLEFDDIRLQPFTGVQYMYLDQRGFTESGAGAFDLSTSDQIVSSVRNGVGVRLFGETTWRDILLTPMFVAHYQHEWGNGTSLMTTSYSGIPTAQFSVAGTQTGRDFGLFSIGTTASINDRFSLFGSIDAQVASGYSAVIGSGGFKYSW